MIRRFAGLMKDLLGQNTAPGGSSFEVSVSGDTPRLEVRASHAAPQSRQEIEPIILKLQEMDHLLDIIWNPKSILLEPGYYTGAGKLVEAKYSGRYEVIRHNTENNHVSRGDYAVLVTLSEPKRQDGLIFCEKGGPFAPVAEWVLEMMRLADSQNVKQFEDYRKKLWAQHQTVEDNENALDEGMAREGLDRVHFNANFAGRSGNWIGRGADFAEMRKRAAAAR